MQPFPVLATLRDAPGLRGKTVRIPSEYGLTDTIQSIISHRHGTTDPFLVLDLSHVVSLFREWTLQMPLVRPFYAIKVNPTPCFLTALAALGVGFECASQVEIETVLALGVSTNRIVYASACKPESHVAYASRIGINVTTFDSVHELEKIRRFHPSCSLLIRISPPGGDGSPVPSGSKFGAFPEEVEPLLRAAREAGLSVIGVSIHLVLVKNCFTYGEAIAASRSAFDMAERLGMPKMSVLNVGGGFTAGQSFKEASSVVMDAIRSHFPDYEKSGLKTIAEPGRYFADSAFTMVANVIGKRVRGEVREYWINDGIYGSVNPRIREFGSLKCLPLACLSNSVNPTCEGAVTFSSNVFGPTSDPADTVLSEYELPELEVGDWLVFPRMGAYTAPAFGCNFNGFRGSEIPTYAVLSGPDVDEK